MKHEGLQAYQRFILECVGPIIKKHVDAKRADVDQSFSNHLLTGSSFTPSATNLDPTEDFAIHLFYGFAEIQNCYEALLDAPVYFRRFPFSKSRITKSRYLTQQVAIYFDAIYILKNRLDAYAKKLMRSYQKSANAEELSNKLNAVLYAIDQVLEQIITVRGFHVHERRYTDDGLDRLATLELLSSLSDVAVYKALYENAIREEKTKWIKYATTMNETIQKLLDVFFSTLLSAISENEDLIYPETYRASNPRKPQLRKNKRKK